MRHSLYFSHLKKNTFFVFCCVQIPMLFVKCSVLLFFYLWEKKVILTASTQRYTAQKYTHTYTYPLSALWPLSPPLLVSLSCSVNNIVSVGWGCDVVSCKAWPFLRFAHTQALTNTPPHKKTQSLVPCLSYPSGIEVLSLSNLSRLSGTDGWQTDRAEGERREHQDINNASFCLLPLLCLSLHR